MRMRIHDKSLRTTEFIGGENSFLCLKFGAREAKWNGRLILKKKFTRDATWASIFSVHCVKLNNLPTASSPLRNRHILKLV